MIIVVHPIPTGTHSNYNRTCIGQFGILKMDKRHQKLLGLCGQKHIELNAIQVNNIKNKNWVSKVMFSNLYFYHFDSLRISVKFTPGSQWMRLRKSHVSRSPPVHTRRACLGDCGQVLLLSCCLLPFRQLIVRPHAGGLSLCSPGSPTMELPSTVHFFHCEKPVCSIWLWVIYFLIVLSSVCQFCKFVL